MFSSEQRALAPRRSGTPWLLARPNAAPIRLLSGALATSEGLRVEQSRASPVRSAQRPQRRALEDNNGPSSLGSDCRRAVNRALHCLG
jgi:hypothetical protein